MNDQNGEQTTAIAKAQSTDIDITGGLVPRSFDELKRFAALYHASHLAPKSFGSAEQVAIGIGMCMELDIPILTGLQDMSVINGKVAVWGDMALAIVRRSKLLLAFGEWHQGVPLQDDWQFFALFLRVGDPPCRLCREDSTIDWPVSSPACQTCAYTFGCPYVGTWTWPESKLAGFDVADKHLPWRRFTARMMQFKARNFIMRDKFGDVLKGIKTIEEVEDYVDLEKGPGGDYEQTVSDAHKANDLKQTLEDLQPKADDSGSTKITDTDEWKAAEGKKPGIEEPDGRAKPPEMVVTSEEGVTTKTVPFLSEEDQKALDKKEPSGRELAQEDAAAFEKDAETRWKNVIVDPSSIGEVNIQRYVDYQCRTHKIEPEKIVEAALMDPGPFIEAAVKWAKGQPAEDKEKAIPDNAAGEEKPKKRGKGKPDPEKQDPAEETMYKGFPVDLTIKSEYWHKRKSKNPDEGIEGYVFQNRDRIPTFPNGNILQLKEKFTKMTGKKWPFSKTENGNGPEYTGKQPESQPGTQNGDPGPGSEGKGIPETDDFGAGPAQMLSEFKEKIFEATERAALDGTSPDLNQNTLDTFIDNAARERNMTVDDLKIKVIRENLWDSFWNGYLRSIGVE